MCSAVKLILLVFTICSLHGSSRATSDSRIVGYGWFIQHTNSSSIELAFASSSRAGGEDFELTGFGHLDPETNSSKFILQGIDGKVCLKGELNLATSTWTIIGRSEHSLIEGSGVLEVFPPDPDIPSIGISGAVEVYMTNLWITQDESNELAPICGSITVVDVDDYDYHWQSRNYGTPSADWLVCDGRKSGEDESHEIEGQFSGNVQSGCLTSFLIDVESNSISGEGHVRGRNFLMVGHYYDNMLIIENIWLASDTERNWLGGEYVIDSDSSGSFSTDSSLAPMMGTMRNGRWSTGSPNMPSSEDRYTGTYGDGEFRGIGQIFYMDAANIGGQYGAGCWFTKSSISVSCPKVAPVYSDNGMSLFTSNSFYICGDMSPIGGNRSVVTASGWINKGKDLSYSGLLTSEPIDITGEIHISANDQQDEITLTGIGSNGVQFLKYSGTGQLYVDSGIVSGSVGGDGSEIIVVSYGRLVGSKFAVMGTLNEI